MQGDRHLALIYIRTAADGAGAEHLFGWELYLLRLRQNHRSGRWHHVMGLEERRHHRQKRKVGRLRRVVHQPEQPRFGQNGENHPRGREHRGVVYRNIHLEHVRCGDLGTGSLTARTTSEYAFHQNDTKDCTLIIKDCAIDIQGSANSLISYYNGDGTQVLNLVLDNATLKVKGSTGGWGWRYAGIESLKSVQLKNCHIETPGGRFGQQNGLTSYELLGEDDDTYYGEVSIVPENGGETGITRPEASAAVSANAQGIYNMQGVRLGNSPDALPKGIYIVDGKKVVKK